MASAAEAAAEALYNACLDGQTREVRRLLSEGADVNYADGHGRTPLMPASRDGHLEVVDMLLAAEANANAANDDGHTALYGASLQGSSAASLSLWC